MLADVLTPALHSFEALALTAAVVLATVPRSLVMLFLPEKYLGSTVLLPQLAAAGLGYGAITVLATVLLALRMTRRTYVALAAATVLLAAGLGVGWALHGVNGMAAGAAIGALSATLGAGGARRARAAPRHARLDGADGTGRRRAAGRAAAHRADPGAVAGVRGGRRPARAAAGRRPRMPRRRSRR